MTRETVSDRRPAAPVPAADVGQDPGAPSDRLAELVDLAVHPTIGVALRAVREMLGMEVAYISQSVGDELVVRDLEGDGESFLLAPDRSMPRRESYCQRMLDGRIPNLIPDVGGDERTASMPITSIARIGAYATVPLTFGDGRLYGTLCAASHDAKSFDYHQLGVLKVIARMVADQLERQETNQESTYFDA